IATPSANGLSAIIAKALQKDPEKRYATIDELGEELKELVLSDRAAAAGIRRPERGLSWKIVAVIAAVPLVAVAAVYAAWHRQPVLADTDTILLADFVNQTTDPVFDLTLKQGLAVQLEQSPRLEVFPEDRVRSRLRFMRRSPEEPVTKQIAQE